MGELLAQEKTIVVPGEKIAAGMDFLPGNGTFRKSDDIYASRVGMLTVDGRALKLIPLSGPYMPKTGDTIIGTITDVGFSGWRVDTNCAYSAMLGVKDATSEFINRGADLTQYFNLGDVIVTQIINVTSQKLIDLTLKGPGLRKLGPGRIIKVNPLKVPRIIGKKGSMVSMLKQATNTRIVVGQNGLVWVAGDDPKMELITVRAIHTIEEKAHLTGLTDQIKQFLEKETGNKISIDRY